MRRRVGGLGFGVGFRSRLLELIVGKKAWVGWIGVIELGVVEWRLGLGLSGVRSEVEGGLGSKVRFRPR